MMEHQRDCQDLVNMLYDVLDHIFKYVNVKTLRNTAQVSRSWNEIAKREISKREPNPFPRVLLPMIYQNKDLKFNSEDHFVRKPNTVLVFCSPSPRDRPVLDLEYTIMAEYHKRLPGRMVMLGVDQAMLDTSEVVSCNLGPFHASRYCETLKHGIVGLSVPEDADIKIEVVECVSHEHKTEQKARKIFDKLQDAAEGAENPIFLLFGRSDYSTASHVMRMFNERYEKKPASVWGGRISDFIKRSDDGYPEYRGTHGFLGILLRGPRLRAHCTLLPIVEDLSEMSDKLNEFAATLRMKRRCSGLVSGPKDLEGRFPRRFYPANVGPVGRKCFGKTEDLMGVIKKAMPMVDFLAMFNQEDYTYYGCDHLSKTGDYSLEHKRVISIMILNYD